MPFSYNIAARPCAASLSHLFVRLSLAMTPKIFMYVFYYVLTHRTHQLTYPSPSTGVTGYIAGDAFHLLHQKHSEYEYTVLVRSQENIDVVKKHYPSVQIVLGDLDNFELLKSQAAKADIVLRTYKTI